MKRVDIDPTQENISMLLADDTVGRKNDFIKLLTAINEAEGPFSIFLDAQWGDGKTVLIKAVCWALQYCNPNLVHKNLDENLKTTFEQFKLEHLSGECVPFYFNAWENDCCDDPLSAMLAGLTIEYDLSSYTDTELKTKAIAVIDSISGAFGRDLNSKGLSSAFTGENLLKDFEKKLSIRNKLNEFMDSILPERGNKMVILIDELDRCRPDYAVKMLEQVKHLFEREDVIVVYAVDGNQLGNAIAGIYGTKFDSVKYLERFYDESIKITPVDTRKYLGLHKEGNGDFFNMIIDNLVESNLSMRAMNRMTKIDEARRYCRFVQNSSNGRETIFFEKILLPVAVMLSYADSLLWDKVRTGLDLTALYEYGKQSIAFSEFINFMRPYYRSFKFQNHFSTEMTDEEKRTFVASCCAYLFLPETDNRAKRARSDLDPAILIDVDRYVFRTLTFPHESQSEL